MSLEEVARKALKIVKPSKLEERRLKRTLEKALLLARGEAERIPGIVDITLEGSAAKDTWIKGRAEADIFIHFDPGVSKAELEERIVKLGTRIVEKLGGKPMLMYADHPYVEGTVNGVTVDVVACYKIEPPGWRSATDRTPYHTRYVLENLKPGQEDEVRLLKGFMVGCGVYGAEIKVKGFSGYLTELLTIRYGSFLNVLREASSWRPPIIIDLKNHYGSREEVLEAFEGSPLIVVDPVDRSRNVAAAVSMTRLSEFVLASRLFLRKPSLRFFKRKAEKPKISDIKRISKDRCFIYAYFKLGEEKPRDVIWGELKRSEEGMRKALERLGFAVYRSGSWTDESRRCLLIFELDKLMLPRFSLHKGPPIYLKDWEHFLDRWIREGVGPWVHGDRLYALRRREEVSAVKLLRGELMSGGISVSKDLMDYLQKAYIGSDLGRLMKAADRDERLRGFLWSFLRARPPFL
mgnify:FL=1